MRHGFRDRHLHRHARESDRHHWSKPNRMERKRVYCATVVVLIYQQDEWFHGAKITVVVSNVLVDALIIMLGVFGTLVDDV